MTLVDVAKSKHETCTFFAAIAESKKLANAMPHTPGRVLSLSMQLCVMTVKG